MTIDQLKAYFLQDEFAKNYFLGYGSMLLKNKGFAAEWRAKHPAEITGFEEYEDMFNEFRRNIGSNVSEVNVVCIFIVINIYFLLTTSIPNQEKITRSNKMITYDRVSNSLN